MERMELSVHKREAGKSPSRKLRREGSVPGILYGAKRESSPLYVNRKELDHAVGTDAGWNILLDLNIDGKEKVLARISDYQVDVIDRNLTHIDFQILDISKKIKTDVPIKIIGKAEGVKKGGILEVITRSLQVKCMPTEIPEQIEVDVSGLDIGGNIHVDDLTMPPGVECIRETNFSIATIVAPTEEIVAEVPVPPVVEAVPVEGAVAAPAEGEKAKAPEGKAPEGKAPAAKEGESKKE